jgi:hypothetical protein
LRRRKAHEFLGQGAADVEMLKVDWAVPGSAPVDETVLGEHGHDHFRNTAAIRLAWTVNDPVEVIGSGGRLEGEGCAVARDERVFDGIEVDRRAIGVQRNRGCVGNGPVVEPGGVVICHRGLVVTGIGVDESNFGDGKFALAQGGEDVRHAVGHRVKDDNLAIVVNLIVEPIIAEADQAQPVAADWRAGIEHMMALHAGAKLGADRNDRVFAKRRS